MSISSKPIVSKLARLRKIHNEESKKRKGFLPSFLITAALWLMLSLIVLLLDPTGSGVLQIFFIIFLLANFFTFSLLIAHTRRGLVVSISITSFTFLMYLGVGTILNLALIAGSALMFEIYFTKRK